MASYVYALMILALVLAGLIAGPDRLDISLRFYDSILHFLGGIGIGFFVYGLACSFAPVSSRKWLRIIIGVFVVGLAWEIFEMYYDISGYPLWTALYYADTAKDLALDSVGGVLALTVCHHTRK